MQTFRPEYNFAELQNLMEDKHLYTKGFYNMLGDVDLALLPTLDQYYLEDLSDSVSYNTELLNYDDDWDIFW